MHACQSLARAGVPVGVLAAPVLPGLTDHEMPAILEAAAGAGAMFAGYTVLRLPYAVKELFSDWLDAHYPDRKEKVLARVRAMRGGKLNDPSFGGRMRGEGPFAQNIDRLFKSAKRRAGFPERGAALSTEAFRFPPGPQLELFGGEDPGAA